MDQQSNIYVVTGRIQSGKTTFLSELVRALKEKKNEVAGFLSKGQSQDGERLGFTLVNVQDGSEILLASRENTKTWLRYGRFFFNPEAFAEGERIIKKAIAQESKLVILDEVGPLEMEAKGWADMLDILSKEKKGVQIWVVRENILDQVLERWGIPRDQVILAESMKIEDTIKRIYPHG